MSDTKRAIYEAVAGLPAELCGLMAEYLDERPHTWTAMPNAVNIETDGRRTDLIGDPTSTVRWNRMVSTESFESGHLSWTVEFQETFTDGFIRIGAGVSMRLTNSFSDERNELRFSGLTDEQDRLLVFARYSEEIGVAQGGRVVYQNNYESNEANRRDYRIVFQADPVHRRVVASVWQLDKSTGIWRLQRSDIVLPTDADDFVRLRPAIFLDGRQRAVVWSNECRIDRKQDGGYEYE